MSSFGRGPRALQQSFLFSLSLAAASIGVVACGDDGAAKGTGGGASTSASSTGGQGGGAGQGGAGGGGATTGSGGATTGSGGGTTGTGGAGGAPACGLPELIGRIDMESGEQAFDVALEGTMLYVTLESDGVRAFDLSDAEAGPTARGILDLPNAKRIAVRDQVAYVTMLGSGLAAVDFADPDAPVLRGEIVQSGRTLYDLDLDPAGERAYAATDGLLVYDVTMPEGPTQVALQDDGGGRALAREGDTIFSAFEIFGINAYDVASPDAPVLVATFDDNSSFHALDVHGGILLAGGTNSGLVRLDATALDAIVVTGSTGGESIDDIRFRSDGLALAAAGDDGVLFVDVSGDEPVVVGTLATEGPANGIAIGGAIIAIAEEGGGVVLLDACPPAG